MSSNFERLHEISNEAYAENLSILSQKLANTLLYLSLHFLMGIPFLRRIQKEIQSEFHSKFQSEFPLEFQSDNCHVIENTYSIHSGNLSFNTVSSTDHLFLIDYTSTANVTSERFHRDLPWISI